MTYLPSFFFFFFKGQTCSSSTPERADSFAHRPSPFPSPPQPPVALPPPSRSLQALGLAHLKKDVMTASMEEQEADQLRLAVAESMCRSPVGPITHNLRQL